MITGMGPGMNIPQLTVARSDQDGIQVIALSGELDLRAVGELETAIAAAGDGARVCLDLSELQFIDSSGLATVVRGHQALAATDGRLVVVCVAGAVHRTFETTGLTALLTLVGDRAAALVALCA